MSKLTDDVEKAISGYVIDLGLELEYTELVKEGENSIYRIVVDKAESKVSIDDCEALSRAVEDIVDKYVNVKEGYVLEVSSAGLERKLANLKLYNKYIGSEVRLKLFKKINDKKELQGKLVSVSDDSITIDKSGEEICIELSNIAHANTIYDFDNI